MRHFLIRTSDVDGTKAALTNPSEIHHLINVLRFSMGEEVILLDGNGGKYLSKICSIHPEKVEFEILSTSQAGAIRESPLQLTLAVALVKRQAMDFIVEKAVEFGVAEIVPLKTERTIVGATHALPLPDHRNQRWQRIIQAAAKQSGQAILPVIKPVTDFDKFLEGISGGAMNCAPTFFLTPNHLIPSPSPLPLGERGRVRGENFAKVLLTENGRGTALRRRSGQARRAPTEKNCLMIGPEGGWSRQEQEKAIKFGAIPVRLADNPLRCETAVVAALALLVNLNILKDL